MPQDYIWDDHSRHFKIGKNYQGSVIAIWQNGVQVLLEDGTYHLQGVVRLNELDWEQLITDARQYQYEGNKLYTGRRIDIHVLDIDYYNYHVICSLRRVKRDPWIEYAGTHQPGKTVQGCAARFHIDEVVIDLEHGLTGVVPKSEFQRLRQRYHMAPEYGDRVEGVIKVRDEARRELHISICDRIDMVEKDIHNAWQQHTGVQIPAEFPSDTVTEPFEYGIAHNDHRGIRLLVVENMEMERFQECAILNDLGYHKIDTATNQYDAEMLIQNPANRYDLVLLDLGLPVDSVHIGNDNESNSNKPDLAFALKLTSIKKTPIVIVTGADLNKLAHDGYDAVLHGAITKPLTYDKLRDAMIRFADTGHVGWPANTDLDRQTQDAVSFMDRISSAANYSVSQSPFDYYHKVLTELIDTISAEAAVVISYNLVTKEPLLVASVNITDSDFEYCKPNLYRSPVTDLIYNPTERIFYNKIRSNYSAEGKFRYLSPIIGGRKPLSSCIGELIETSDNVKYTLFVFSEYENQFTEEDQLVVRATAMYLAAYQRELNLLRQVATEHRMTTMGGIVSSTAHELKGRLTALQAIGSVERYWKQLKANPEACMRESAWIEEMDRRFESLRMAQASMEQIVARMMGWIRTTNIDTTSVYECLGNAISAVREAAGQDHQLIVSDIDEIRYMRSITAVPSDLEQVFVNILLNAIHHSHVYNRRRGVITVRARAHESTKHTITVTISDTGPGIRSSLLSDDKHGIVKIFAPMCTTKPSGTGMGLYISKGLIDQMSGHIEVMSTAILIGTTFKIELG